MLENEFSPTRLFVVDAGEIVVDPQIVDARVGWRETHDMAPDMFVVPPADQV